MSARDAGVSVSGVSRATGDLDNPNVNTRDGEQWVRERTELAKGPRARCENMRPAVPRVFEEAKRLLSGGKYSAVQVNHQSIHKSRQRDDDDEVRVNIPLSIKLLHARVEKNIEALVNADDHPTREVQEMIRDFTEKAWNYKEIIVSAVIRRLVGLRPSA